MSGALGRAAGGALRRLAAAHRALAAPSLLRGAASWPAHSTPPRDGGEGAASGEEWLRLSRRGEKVNPCNSPFHPAAAAGTLPAAEAAPRLSVQQAYDPRGMCFGCGACSRLWPARHERRAGAAPQPRARA